MELKLEDLKYQDEAIESIIKVFIILVPSVAIRQGVLSTFNAFSRQLEEIYSFKPNTFEYDSKKLSKVTNYIEEQHP